MGLRGYEQEDIEQYEQIQPRIYNNRLRDNVLLNSPVSDFEFVNEYFQAYQKTTAFPSATITNYDLSAKFYEECIINYLYLAVKQQGTGFTSIGRLFVDSAVVAIQTATSGTTSSKIYTEWVGFKIKAGSRVILQVETTDPASDPDNFIELDLQCIRKTQN